MDRKIQIQGKWQRLFDSDLGAREFFTIITEHYSIALSGGSVSVSDITTKTKLFTKKGFKYLYTGDVSPDEKVLVALENGKHFYLFSLETLSLLKRVTLPRGYDSTDAYPSFSPDGSELIVPVSRYKDETLGYLFFLCRYDTQNYNLISMTEVSFNDFPAWPV